jgi:3-phosphoshikimate 1-carboxyvinyltransferase
MTVRTIHPAIARGQLRAPPSKSYTHRAFVAGYLAGSECEVVHPLESEDTRATREGLRAMGARIRRSLTGWKISGPSDLAGIRPRPIECGESGTTLRFLTAVAALGSSSVRFVGSRRLADRPMDDLYRALRRLGAEVSSEPTNRSLPCVLRGPIRSGAVELRGDVSSQFISALLMVLPRLDGRSEIRVRGPRVSEPYIAATCSVLKDRGIQVRRSSRGFVVQGPQRYRAGRIYVPGDASSASYLWAAAAMTGGEIEVSGIPGDLPQADLAILPVLSDMGARVRRQPRTIRVAGPLTRGINVDLTDAPDLFPLAAVLAAMVPGRPSRLRGAPQLAFKESDRRVESARLARGFGARVSSTAAGLEILGSPVPRPCNLPSLTDHRVVMSAAVGALAAHGVSRVGRAEAVSKSYPGFWKALQSLTAGGGRVP